MFFSPDMLQSALIIGSLLILACYFFVKGRWPKRQGEQPHCAKCDYVLTGASSPQCPECGEKLDQQSIVLGDRKPVRWKLGVAAALVLVSGGLITREIVQVVRSPYWRQHKPTASMIRELEKADAARASAIFQSLATRVRANDISQHDVNETLELAFRRLADTPHDKRDLFVGGSFLQAALETRRIAQLDAERLIDEYSHYQLCVPPIVPRSAIRDSVIEGRVRSPNLQASYSHIWYSARPINDDSATAWSWPSGDTLFVQSVPVSIPCNPDDTQISCAIEIEIGFRPGGGMSSANQTPVMEMRKLLKSQTVVVDDDAYERAVAGQFQKLTPKLVHIKYSDISLRPTVNWPQPIPVDMFVDVYCYGGDKSTPLGSTRYLALAGDSGEVNYHVVCGNTPPNRVKVILIATPSEDVIVGSTPVKPRTLIDSNYLTPTKEKSFTY